MMSVCGLSPEALPGGIEGELIRKSGAILTTPAVSKEDFGKIIAYYAQSAPKTLALPERPAAVANLRQFRARPLELKFAEPFASLVHINPTNGSIFVGDGKAGVHLVCTPDCKQAGARRLRRFPASSPMARRFTHGTRTLKRPKGRAPG